MRPLSVISTDLTLVRSRRPEPQAPWVKLAEAISARSTAALSPEALFAETGPCPGEPEVSAADGSFRTVSQPEPIELTPVPAGWAAGVFWPGFTLVILAPGGGVKLISAGAGVANVTAVKPTEVAGLEAPRANTCTRSGTPLCPSMASRTWPTSDLESFGAS